MILLKKLQCCIHSLNFDPFKIEYLCRTSNYHNAFLEIKCWRKKISKNVCTTGFSSKFIFLTSDFCSPRRFNVIKTFNSFVCKNYILYNQMGIKFLVNNHQYLQYFIMNSSYHLIDTRHE